MNSQRNITRTLLVSAIFTLAGSVPNSARAATRVLNPGNGPDIIVDWNDQADPILDFDFEVDFACPTCELNPNVRLVVGNSGWTIASELVEDLVPTIGDIGVIDCPFPDNFGVSLGNASTPGARNVLAINLKPSNAANSSVLSTSWISGDLAGSLVVQKSTGGAGGDCLFRIGGDAEGKIIVPDVNELVIDGTLSGGVVADRIVADRGIEVRGDLTGSISVGLIEESASLVVWNDVTSKAEITISDMESGVADYRPGMRSSR